MKVHIKYRSGAVANFVVSDDILHHEFVALAIKVGGSIRTIEFPA